MGDADRHPPKLFMTSLILASSSPRRKILFNELNLNFRIIKPSIVEKLSTRNPVEYVRKVSKLKAEAVSKSHQGLIVGVDTVVVIRNKILGKPKDRKEARAMIRLLSNKTHRVLSGITVIDTGKQRYRSAVEETKVRFRKLSSREIENYIRTTEPYDKAGGYAIQGRGGLFVKWIRGCYCNVVGLPVVKLLEILNT